MKWQKVLSMRARKPTEDQWLWRRYKVEAMPEGPVKYQIAAIVFWDWLPEGLKINDEWDRLLSMKIEQTPPREELIEALSIVGYSRDFAEARVLPDGYDERCKEQQAKNQRLRDQRRKERKLAAIQKAL